MKNTTEIFFAIVPPGFEHLCAAELRQITSSPLNICYGGIAFSGKLRELYLANLWLRCASRVLVRLDCIKCRDFPTLFQKSLRLPWGKFIKPQRRIEVRASCHTSRLNHSARVAETIEQAIYKALDATPVDCTNLEPQLVFARFEDDMCTISVDSSGELLHKRGYRKNSAVAPLRETLAAGCLLHCNWRGNLPLWDPFCGSGTLPIEAALLAANMPPSLQRSFSCQLWPGYREGLWQTLVSEAQKVRREVKVSITGSDINATVLQAAISNAQHAGVADLVSFKLADAMQAQAPAATGMIICNPPYGERLKTSGNSRQLLVRLQGQLRDNYPHWRGWALLPQETTDSSDSFSFSNGGLNVTLYPLHKRLPSQAEIVLPIS